MDKYLINNQPIPQQVFQSFYTVADFFFYVKSLLDSGALSDVNLSIKMQTIIGDQYNIPVYIDITNEFRMWRQHPTH